MGHDVLVGLQLAARVDELAAHALVLGGADEVERGVARLLLRVGGEVDGRRGDGLAGDHGVAEDARAVLRVRVGDGVQQRLDVDERAEVGAVHGQPPRGKARGRTT
jgi:hypothetical protein